MPGLFGSESHELNENLNSYILSLLDQTSLRKAACVSKDWQIAVRLLNLRVKIFDTVLTPSNLFNDIVFYKFDIQVLVGGLTNSTVKLTLDYQAYVARLPGNQTDQYISRIAEYTNATIASLIQINPAIYYYDPESGTQLTAYLNDAITMTPESMKQPGYLNRTVMVLKQLHFSSIPFSNNIDLFIRNDDLLKLIEEKHGQIDPRYKSVFDSMETIRKIIQSLSLPTVACHNDANPGNFLFSKNKMYLIDWEYSGNNLPIWDLICLSKEAGFLKQEQLTLLQTYYEDQTKNHIPLFNLLMPVYDLWAALWARVQLTNQNIKTDAEALNKLEQKWLNSCEAQLLDHDFINAVNYFKSHIEKPLPVQSRYQLFYTDSVQDTPSALSQLQSSMTYKA